MNRIIFCVFVLCLATSNLFAQNSGAKFQLGGTHNLQLDFGVLSPGGSVKESLEVRQNPSYYYDNNYRSGSVNAETSIYNFGASYEYFLDNLKSGLSTGIRFTNVFTEVFGHSSHQSDFFFLRYSEDESDTKFARVKNLTEHYAVLSIPLELRVQLLRWHDFSLFARAGMEYAFVKLTHSLDIEFQQESMDLVKDVVLDKIKSPLNNQYATAYASLGLTYGKEGKINAVFELMGPATFLTNDNFHLVDLHYNSGFKLAVIIPLTKTQNIAK